MNGRDRIGSRKDLIWWRNLVCFCHLRGSVVDPFVANILRVVGNSLNISFLNNIFIGFQCLKDVFPELHDLSNSPNNSVAEAEYWEGEFWHWNFNFSFVSSLGLIWMEKELLGWLDEVKPHPNTVYLFSQ